MKRWLSMVNGAGQLSSARTRALLSSKLRALLSLSIIILSSLLVSTQVQLNVGQSELSIYADATAAPVTGAAFSIPVNANTITWITSFGTTPASVTVQLQTSNDNSIWSASDTSTSTAGESRTIFTAAKFVRCVETARSGGSTVTVTLIAKASPVTNTALNSASDVVVNSVSVGSTPATTGTLRLPNNSYITARNAANSADLSLIKIGNTDLAEIGVTTLSINALSSAGGVTTTGTGTITSAASVTTSAAGYLNWIGRSRTYSPADGQWFASNNTDTFGVVLKFLAVPTIGACGTSPSVAADSTDSVGTIVVGTATPASCVLNFSSAWTKAPKCTVNVVTATAADVRAVGVSATTTVLTITPASVFAATTSLYYICASVK